MHPALGGVVKAQRFAFDGAVLAQVIQAHQSRVVGVVLYFLHHGLCDRALVKRIRPAIGDALQHLDQTRVLQAVTDRPGLAIGLVKIGPRLGVLLQIGGTAQQLMQPVPHRKPVLGQGDGGFEQTRPRQAAVVAVGQFEHAQHAGHTHRQTADGRRSHVHGAAFAHEQVFGGGRWGGFAPVVGPHALAVVVEQKSPATDATRLWLNQGEHHLHGDGCVQRRPALAQDVQARLAGQGVGGAHPLACKANAALAVQAGGGFGLQRVIYLPPGRASAPGPQHGPNQTQASGDAGPAARAWPGFSLHARRGQGVTSAPSG